MTEEDALRYSALGDDVEFNRALFTLARCFLTLTLGTNLGRIRMRNLRDRLLSRWYRLNKHALPEEIAYQDVYEEFHIAHSKVKTPFGVNPLEEAWQEALKWSKSENPYASEFLKDSTKKYELTALLCQALQELAGEGVPFFISTPNLKEKLGLKAEMSAWRILKALERRKIVEIVKKGNHKSANRYIFHGLKHKFEFNDEFGAYED